MEDMLHVCITRICGIVNVENLLVVLVFSALVKNAQHPVELVVDLTVQTRYLNNNTVVSQTVDKGVGNPSGHNLLVVVVRMVTDVENRLFYAANFVP